MRDKEQKITLREVLQYRFDENVDIRRKVEKLYVLFDLGFKLELVPVKTMSQLGEALKLTYEFPDTFDFENDGLIQELINTI